MKKLFTLFLALVASVGAINAQSGSCGDNLTWTLSNGTLTISGTGAMAYYSSSSDVPWHDYRSSILSVIISDGVTSIGKYAFYDCSSLTSVIIPNSVTSIGGRAFLGCSKLTSITIPNSVTSIGGSAFRSCSSLTSINVDANNANYCSINGVLFSKDKTTLIQYPIGNTRSKYIIPNSVTSIGNWAFYSCFSLTSVTIGNSVTSIGENAFHWCYSLTSVTIGNSVTSIGNSAFYNCSFLTSVTIGNSVTSIGEYAFYDCSSLTSVTIPNSVTIIGSGAFEGTGIYSNEYNWEYDVLYINDCLISAKAFISGAYTIEAGTRLIADAAFSSCKSLTSITIPNSVISIGDYAFYDCSSLTSVTIGNGVTSIGGSAFLGCSKLTSITIPNSVTSIGERAFNSCTSLTSVTIGNSVTSIGDNAFSSCFSLTSITIPNSVTSIGDYAFGGCFSLTSITIPNSVTSIGDRAFNSCTSLTSVTIEAETPPTLGDNAEEVFKNTNNCPIYVPGNAVNAYKTAWWPYADRIVGTSDCVNDTWLQTGGSGLGEMTTDNSDVWFYDAQYGAKAIKQGGYIGHLMTPAKDLRGMKSVTLSFMHTHKFAGTPSNELTLWVTPDYKGSIEASQWQQLTIAPYAANTNWTFVSVSINVPVSKVGANTVFAFEYMSTAYNYATWNIKNLTLIAQCATGEQGVDNIDSSNLQGGDRGRLILRDGQVLILRNGKTYTMQGQEVK